MIFPGMDPYLEDPCLWPGVHNRLVVYIADQLQPRLPPHYVAALEERVYVEDTPRQYVPDVTIRQRGRREEQGAVAVMEVDEAIFVEVRALEIHESYVEIRDLRTNQRVVTVIEVVSPTNKRPGPGQDSYLTRQREVLQSTAHLVEIDLLRGGQSVVSVPGESLAPLAAYHYLACVNPGPPDRGKCRLYPRYVWERLPRIGVPLADGDPDVPLDVQAAIEQVYEAGRYREVLDYRLGCVPPLEAEARTWAETLVAEARKGKPQPGA